MDLSNPWLWALGFALVAGLLALASLWSAGRFARRLQGRASQALPTGEDALLDRLAPGGQGRALLLADPVEALRMRLLSARAAERSLDLIYYLWEDDFCGSWLAAEVLAAADRGVRVRILLDDIYVLGPDPLFRALDQHPMIEVRLFNPIRHREPGLRRGLELLLNFLPYNRRMHNKLWLADGRLSITGGRNIADEYFGQATDPDENFDDLDIVVTGPVVADAEGLFDDFWNAGIALPIRRLLPGRSRKLRRARGKLRRRLDARAARMAELDPGPETGAWLSAQLARSHDAPSARLVADPPQKALGKGRSGWLPAALLPLLAGARTSLSIATPYFVPGSEGLALLLQMRQRGVALTLVTNGLSVSENVFVFGAYAWYRTRLLLAGTRIFEAASHAAPPRRLHAKAVLVDNATGFVGTFNFDQRSAFLNTEMGILFDDPALVAELREVMRAQRQPARAWHVGHDGSRTHWKADGLRPQHVGEPDSTAPRRLLARLLGLLPIHRFL